MGIYFLIYYEKNKYYVMCLWTQPLVKITKTNYNEDRHDHLLVWVFFSNINVYIYLMFYLWRILLVSRRWTLSRSNFGWRWMCPPPFLKIHGSFFLFCSLIGQKSIKSSKWHCNVSQKRPEINIVGKSLQV